MQTLEGVVSIHEVSRHVITGMLNKQIAAELNIAEHTVKIHRGGVMEEFAVDSVAVPTSLPIEPK
jgi:FixJ family two-component response regulator